MSVNVATFYGEVIEDHPASFLARVCSLSGSGNEIQDEGPVIQAADVATITCKVYDISTDRDAETGTEITPAPTLTAANVFALRTAGWGADQHGYNFRHDIAGTFFADPDEWRLLEYDITLTDIAGGTVIPLTLRVKIRSRTRS